MFASCASAVFAQAGRKPEPGGTPERSRKPDPGPLSQFPVEKRWTLDLEHQLTEQPAFHGTHAYFAVEGDQIAAYDLVDGDQQWLVTAHPQFALVTGDDLLFIVEDDRVKALAAEDGQTVWQLPLPGSMSVPPAWDNGWLVLTMASGRIVALSAKDGRVIWQRDLSVPARVPAALAADRVYIAGDGGHIIALRVDTGATVWESTIEGNPTGLLALDDRVFVGSTDNFFYCVSAENGLWNWRWRTGADIIGLPIVDARNVYFVSLDNVLRALSQRSGVQQWARPLPIRPTRGPVATGSSIIVTGVAPTLRAYRMTDGAPAGDLATAGELAAPAFPLIGASVPSLVVVTRNLATGATATRFDRRIEPSPAALTPLANPVPLPPLPAELAQPPASDDQSSELPPSAPPPTDKP